jgi:hypothetical protein
MSGALIELHDVSRIYDLGHVQVAALMNVDLEVQVRRARASRR